MSLSVSVLIPTYNYAERIIEAIKSVLNQRYPSSLIEIIVVDDGSTDNTQEVLNELVDNKSIKYFYQSNQGKASATIKAIKESTGDIIFCLDADDSFLPGKIQKTVEIFEQNYSVYGRKDDNRIEKNRNLLASSSAILTYLSNDKIDNKLTKLYSQFQQNEWYEFDA